MKQLLSGATLTALLASYGCGCPDEFISGVLIPTGSTMEVLAEGNGRLYSMYGAERISKTELKDVALLHVLILAADTEVRGGGSGIDTRCLKATERFTWQLGNWQTGPFNLPDRILELHYDGRVKRLTVGSESLSTTETNCFVVRLDSEWRPSVSRVRLLIPERIPLRMVMDQIREAEADTPDVRGVRLHSEARAVVRERPNNEMQRTKPAQATELRR